MKWFASPPASTDLDEGVATMRFMLLMIPKGYETAKARHYA